MKLDLKVVNPENSRAQLSSFSVWGLPYKQTTETQVAVDLRAHFPQCSCSLEPREQSLVQNVLVWKKVGCSLSIYVVCILIRSTATFLGMCSFQLDKFVSAAHAVTVNLVD